MHRPPRPLWLLTALAAAFVGCGGDAGIGAAARVEGSYEVPTTPWGDPDLAGMWPIDKLNGTPVQRPETTRPFATSSKPRFERRQAARATP